MKRKVDSHFIKLRTDKAVFSGYQKPKYIEFCEDALSLGLEVYIYEARKTRSKYVYLSRINKRFKVRFSNHKPSRLKQAECDSDFYVGVSHEGVTTTSDAIEAVRDYFKI